MGSLFNHLTHKVESVAAGLPHTDFPSAMSHTTTLLSSLPPNVAKNFPSGEKCKS